MPKAPIFAALFAGILAGCAQFAPAPPAVPRTVAARFDGSYQGREALVAAATPACPPSSQGVIEIGDATLYYAYTPEAVFTVPVQPDGVLHGVAGAVTLDGRIAGDDLDMTVRMPGCESRYRMHYVWNHS